VTIIKLPDGRDLDLDVSGPEDSMPLIYHHGTAGELGNVAAFVYEAAKGSPGEWSSPQPKCPSLAPQQGSRPDAAGMTHVVHRRGSRQKSALVDSGLGRSGAPPSRPSVS
jgi:hypothetical protein